MRSFSILAASALLFSLSWANPQCYIEGYPTLISSADEDSIVLKDGTKLPYHTNSIKSTWDEQINNADLAT
jgi:hypothetical protein